MPIVVIGLSHHSAPVAVRERFAFAEARIPSALEELRRGGTADEAVILSTCNRVEIYAATSLEPRRAFSALQDFLLAPQNGSEAENGLLSPALSSRGGEGEKRGPGLSSTGGEGEKRGPGIDEMAANDIYKLSEPQSIQHLFKVACGLDSLVLGETEILGQLKRAYDLALQAGHTGGRLNKAFQRAFNVAKHIRTSTNIQRGSVSVGSVAVELAEKIFTSLREREVMIIGAGDTGEKTARALLSRGARSIVVSNRSHEKAVALASELGGRAVSFEDWAAEFANIDIVISSTAAPHYIINRAKLEPLMKLRRNRPLLLIDIAVPRDIEPEVNLMPNIYLYNIDDLQGIADQALKQRHQEIAVCEEIIRQKTAALLAVAGSTVPNPEAEPAFGHE